MVDYYKKIITHNCFCEYQNVFYAHLKKHYFIEQKWKYANHKFILEVNFVMIKRLTLFSVLKKNILSSNNPIVINNFSYET